MAVDAQDNVWILDTTLATAMKLSPDGRLLMTIGKRGQRGDWDEAKGQRLLWQPVMIAFGRNGDLYIAQGHGNESPNDTDSDDPANNIGSARFCARQGRKFTGSGRQRCRQGKFLTPWLRDRPNHGTSGSATGGLPDRRYNIGASSCGLCRLATWSARFNSTRRETRGWRAARNGSSSS